MIRFILILIFILPVSLYGQVNIISGKIIDSETRAPLYNANIYLKKGTYGTASNTEGRFTLEIEYLSMDDTIIVSHLSYEEFRMAVSDFVKSNHFIILKKHPFLLEEITVYGVPTAKQILNSALRNIENNYIVHQTFIGAVKQTASRDNKIFRLHYSKIAINFPKKLSRKTIVTALPASFKKEDANQFEGVNLLRLEEVFQFININRALGYYIRTLDSSNITASVQEKKMGNYDVYEVVLEKTAISRVTILVEKNSKAVVSIQLDANSGSWKDTIPDIYKNGNKIESVPVKSDASINFSPYKNKWIPRDISGYVIVEHQISDSVSVEKFSIKNSAHILINDISKKSVKGRKLDIGKDFYYQIKSIEIPNDDILNEEEIRFIKGN